MTKEELTAMTPAQLDRLDSWLAQHVIGWVDSRECGRHWQVPPDSNYFREWDNATWPHAPRFTRSIADAFEYARLVSIATGVL